MSLRNALTGGGVVLTILAFLIGNITGEQAKPIETTIEVIAETPPEPTPVPICRTGWKEASNKDEHTPVLSCTRDGWTVWLRPDLTFDYAWPGNGPFITDSSKVPGW